MKEYHGLYLKCEILLLAALFKKLGNNSLKKYGLYPSHYLSESGLSCDAMLKMTNTELQLIPDRNIYIYIYIYIYICTFFFLRKYKRWNFCL